MYCINGTMRSKQKSEKLERRPKNTWISVLKKDLGTPGLTVQSTGAGKRRVKVGGVVIWGAMCIRNLCVNDDCVHGYWVQKTYDPFNKKTLTAMCFFNVISEYLTKLMK